MKPVDHIIDTSQVDLTAIARQFGTPIFVFSGDAIRRRVSEFRLAFEAEWSQFSLMPSLKACPLLGVRALLTELDCGCDVFGPGEFEGAIRAGVAPSKISLNGSIKDESIIRKAVELGVRIVIDSPREASLINDLARQASKSTPVMLRLKPDLGDLNTTSDFAPEITITELGQRIKYGIPNSELDHMAQIWDSWEHIHLVGFHAHIGRHSKQLSVWEAWATAVASKVLDYESLLKGVNNPVVNVGGGFASELDADLDVIDRSGETPELKQFASAICDGLRAGFRKSAIPVSNWVLEIEPGRGLHSDAGVHLTTVRNLKEEKLGQKRRWAEVDTSEVFLDLHGVPDERPLTFTCISRPDSTPDQIYDVVGLTCNAEMLALDATLPELSIGDILCLSPTGAYLEPMAANFNALPRPGSVLVDRGEARLIKRHETVEDVFARDIMKPVAAAES